jgi:adenine-specific DNA methylase
MQPKQQPLFPDWHERPFRREFPSTRYQGSKRKLVEWLWVNVADLQFDTVLDVFGGTGVVSYLFKTAGKGVTYNDFLAFNWNIGLALVENGETCLLSEDIECLLQPRADIVYPDFIQRTFGDIYFTDEENAWLDRVVYHIDHLLTHPIKQALARYALFQACIIKRPYNLFHRANLYMRTADVKRSFGNKATWDTPFETHFRNFVEEANGAVFDNQRDNQALRLDALETPTGADLVYIDPPYINQKGVGVDYLDFYHFLEGLTNYDSWETKIDQKSKHRRWQRQDSPWTNAREIYAAFESLIARHRDSILVVSYRDDGIPSREDLHNLLGKYKTHVREAEKSQKYVLSIRDSNELLLVAA